jgi:uncharacterized protein
MPPPAASRKRLSEWTILGDAQQGVLLDRSSLRVKPLGGELAGIVASIIDAAGDIPDDATDWHEIARIIAGIDRLPGLEGIERQIPREVFTARDAPAQAGGLYKLAISVADTCNLACAYCYANQGRFERSAGRVMAPELAERLVDNAVRRFSSIDTVQFIGGEPTLNLPAIERACEAFQRAVDTGQLPELPRFVVTTNGVRLGEKFLRLASAYDVHPTISLDGPRAVHDRGRFAANGEPTYDQIRANIDALEDAGLSVEYEATFSRLHLEEGLHLIDLCQWFRDELGVRVLHAPPVSAGPYTPAALTLSLAERVREYSAAAEWAVDNLLLRGELLADSFAARVIEALVERSRSPSICVAGNDLLCIAADGGVYPCWMFIGEEALRLGSFAEPDPRAWDWTRARELFGPGDLDAYPECARCFAQPLCFGCRASDHRATGGLEEKLACAFPRAIIASVVTRLFHQGPAEETTAADYLARPSFGERLFVCSTTGC